jgi:hypothetical protein
MSSGVSSSKRRPKKPGTRGQAPRAGAAVRPGANEARRRPGADPKSAAKAATSRQKTGAVRKTARAAAKSARNSGPEARDRRAPSAGAVPRPTPQVPAPRPLPAKPAVPAPRRGIRLAGSGSSRLTIKPSPTAGPRPQLELSTKVRPSGPHRLSDVDLDEDEVLIDGFDATLGGEKVRITAVLERTCVYVGRAGDRQLARKEELWVEPNKLPIRRRGLA